ncbi:MAG TPA: trypsin-like peptidase domain-containing protein [Phycisphaerae bacterium]
MFSRRPQRLSVQLFGVLAALGFLFPVLAAAQVPQRLREADLKTLQDAFTSLADRVRPSVVAISTYEVVRGGGSEGNPRQVHIAHSQGSGVIFRADGHILTNHHVIEDAEDIRVMLFNGEELPAKLVQSDARSDLAVLQVERANLRPAQLGDLSKVRQGQWTFAFGNPFGLGNHNGRTSFSVGNVSALDRALTEQLDPTQKRYYGNLIETTSAINPGNSGGPLFNIDGEMMGVVTAIESRSGVSEGIGFAIPICERTKRIIDTLAAGHEVRYGYLGVNVDDVSLALRRELGLTRSGGAIIRSFAKGASPSAQANLRQNDVIVEFDGVPIENADHLVRLVGATQVGSAAAVKVMRDGKLESTTLALNERPDLDAGRPQFAQWLGATLAEPSDEQLASLNITRENAGIAVVRVRSDSRAYAAGLRDQQMIMRFDGKRVHTIAEFEAAVQRAGRHMRLELSDHTIVHIEEEGVPLTQSMNR